MIHLVNSKLKGPAKLTINGFIVQRVIGGEVHAWYKKMKFGGEPGNRLLDSLIYRGDDCAVIISLDDGPHGVLLHASISHADRDPSWETIKALKTVVFGDIDAMMVLPRQADYVNVHQHCFHLWQIPEKWGIA